jgi:4-amino-4-deoxy-L-arabinose transferase-like glycosyltransferase
MHTTPQLDHKQLTGFHLLLVLALLATFFLIILHLTSESMAYDEGWSMWAVRPDGTGEMIARVAADVHPPLYFLTLDGWVAQIGESDLAARMLSAACAMLGLATLYAVGVQLFDRWTALLALIVMGTSSFFVYYGREARMYSLLLALASLSMWAYWRWQRDPSRLRTIIYAISMAALFYTHYYGLLIVATQVLHLWLVAPKQLGRWLLCGSIALLLLAPWLPVWIEQVRLHPHGPLAQPTPTNESTVTWLILMLTSGLSIWMTTPYVLGRALLQISRYRSALLLLLAWLFLTPISVLAANAYIAPLYQPRYIIGILPALALLIAYGLRHVCWKPLAVILLIGLVGVQLLAYSTFWPSRPHWKESMASMIAARQPGEPTLTLLASQSIEAYYDRQLGLRNNHTLDLAGHTLDLTELRQSVDTLKAEPSVWIVLPTNVGATWEIAALLNQDRHVGYRNSVVNVIFYRFDQGRQDDRPFRFGQQLHIDETNINRVEVQQNETVCVTMTLSVLDSLGQEYSAGLHLVNEANTLIAQQDDGLNTPPIGQQLNAARCIEIPATAPEGIYYLHWVIYNWANGERLPVLEGNGAGVFWGDAYVVGPVTITR